MWNDIKVNINNGISIYKERVESCRCSIPLCLLMGIVIGSINGFFGGGGGMVCVPILSKIFCIEDKSAHATTIFIMLPLSIVSYLIYLYKGNIGYAYTIPIVMGVVIGGIVGSILLKKLSNKVISVIFSILILYGGIRLLF